MTGGGYQLPPVPKACTHQGCTKAPRWHVGWRAWALGYPKIDRNSVEGFFQEYVVCDEHREGLDVNDLLLPAGRERINGAMLQMGRALLDFTTAELSFKSVDDGIMS